MQVSFGPNRTSHNKHAITTTYQKYARLQPGKQMKVSLSNKQLSNVKTYNEWLSLNESINQSDYASSRYNSSKYDTFESSRSLLTNHTERLANLINHSRLVELSRFQDES
jgi:hypothetical protein